jgi:hypothetical protein
MERTWRRKSVRIGPKNKSRRIGQLGKSSACNLGTLLFLSVEVARLKNWFHDAPFVLG